MKTHFNFMLDEIYLEEWYIDAQLLYLL